MLFDTTQLALERTIPAPPSATRRWPPTSPTPTRPATGASTSTSTARWPQRSAPRTPRAVEHTGVHDARPTLGRRDQRRRLNSIDVDNESAKLAANALEQQAAVPVAQARTAILRSAMGVG